MAVCGRIQALPISTNKDSLEATRPTAWPGRLSGLPSDMSLLAIYQTKDFPPTSSISAIDMSKKRSRSCTRDYSPLKRCAMDSAVPHQQSRGPEAEQLTTARNDGRPAVHHAKETPSSPLLSQRRHPGKSQSYQEQIPQATGSTKTEEPRTEVAAEAPAPAQTYERKIQQRILDEPLVQHQHSKAQDQLFAEPYLEVLDNGVAVNWKKAAVNVDNFVRSLTLNSTDGPCSSPPRVWDDLDPDLQNTLLCWTPRAREIFQDPQRMQYLCAARIWHTLHDYVFSADPRRIREWMGPDWGHFAELKETFKGKSTRLPSPHRHPLANISPNPFTILNFARFPSQLLRANTVVQAGNSTSRGKEVTWTLPTMCGSGIPPTYYAANLGLLRTA